MPKYLLIDGNSVGYASHHATKLSSGGQETQAVFGFLKTMRELRVTYPDHTPIVLWDGRAEWRFALNPSYKSNRNDDPKKVAVKEAYKSQTPFIRDALEALGIRQMTVATHEADDMAGYLVSTLMQKPDTEIVLISGDGDWIQLVRTGVTWRDMRDDAKIVTIANLFEKTGYKTPLAYLEGKCLQGDSSDVISGVGGIGEKGAPEFLAEFGSVRNFWKVCADGTFVPKKKAHINLYKGTSPLTLEEWTLTYAGDPADEAAKKKHMDAWPGQGRVLFGRNLKLMQLIKVAKPDPAHVEVRKGQLNRERFQQICEELGFASILKQLDVFINRFETM